MIYICLYMAMCGTVRLTDSLTHGTPQRLCNVHRTGTSEVSGTETVRRCIVSGALKTSLTHASPLSRTLRAINDLILHFGCLHASFTLRGSLLFLQKVVNLSKSCLLCTCCTLCERLLWEANYSSVAVTMRIQIPHDQSMVY